MAADDVDPTLRSAEPMPETLDDGFSPPHHEGPAQPVTGAAEPPSLPAKSPF